MDKRKAERGIVYCNPPIKTNLYQFLYHHLDCNCIIKKTDSSNMDDVEIVAYAADKKYNQRLDKEMENNDLYIIIQGIDSMEVNCIG